MALSPGTRFGPYVVDMLLGAGGMGEVYRARDTQLNRDVALKVLPDAFTLDPDRLARFKREAQVLASINHSNIAAIYGIEESKGGPALVLELVEGPTLADRIALAPISLAEAIPIARQIAEALEAAHGQGIIHRDLKPANIKVNDEGAVKVLDFGLAKALDPTSSSSVNAVNSPTLSVHATQAGIILGTAAYMSPEQARGKAVDKRADIWAFGCVLYEMLTGARPFCGEEVSDTLAFVITKEPEWTALPARTPASIRRLLRRCLQKDRKLRLADIADARLELDERSDDLPAAAPAPAASRRRERFLWIAALTLVSAAALALAMTGAGRIAPGAEMRVEITTPPTTLPASIAISPDGQTIAFVGAASGRQRLWLRSLDSATARPVAGTEGAAVPFWAPHGRSIGFFGDDGRIKRVDLDSGAVRVLARTALQWGAAWNADDTILYAPYTGSLLRIPASGGASVEVTRLQAQQTNHSFPWFLPDGNHFLYYVSGTPDVRGVYVAALDKPEGRRLVDTDSVGASVSAGQLLFVRGTTLYAQPFDTQRLQLSGTPAPIAEGLAIRSAAGSEMAAFSTSTAGRIVYRTGSPSAPRQFAWLDRSGRELERVGSPIDGNPMSPSISSDHRHVAMLRAFGGNIDIWLLDVARGSLSRFTTHAANEIHPLWSPDGTRILFSSNRTGSYALYEKSTTGNAEEKPILPIDNSPSATDWSRDGRVVLLHRRDQKTGSDIWALPIGTDRPPSPVVRTDFDERNAQFSPDAKWIAYESTESGRWEVYLQPFPGPGPRVQVSINGGAQVRWRNDGRELFFIALDDRLMAVPISLPRNAGPAEAGTPVPLFATRIGGALVGASRQLYFVSDDGQRFLMDTLADSPQASPITLILNWKPTKQ